MGPCQIEPLTDVFGAGGSCDDGVVVVPGFIKEPGLFDGSAKTFPKPGKLKIGEEREDDVRLLECPNQTPPSQPSCTYVQ